MSQLQTINEHIIIRDTVGYETISKIDVFDLPQVLSFLKIVSNYINMSNIKNINHNESTYGKSQHP